MTTYRVTAGPTWVPLTGVTGAKSVIMQSKTGQCEVCIDTSVPAENLDGVLLQPLEKFPITTIVGETCYVRSTLSSAVVAVDA